MASNVRSNVTSSRALFNICNEEDKDITFKVCISTLMHTYNSKISQTDAVESRNAAKDSATTNSKA